MEITEEQVPAILEAIFSDPLICRYCGGEKKRRSSSGLCLKCKGRSDKYYMRFGITLDEYDALFADQGGKCAICRVPDDDISRRLFVDHDHETNEVRGLLCSACNTGLGAFKDSPERLIEAISYLGWDAQSYR